jgi:hypothetical protein
MAGSRALPCLGAGRAAGGADAEIGTPGGGREVIAKGDLGLGVAAELLERSRAAFVRFAQIGALGNDVLEDGKRGSGAIELEQRARLAEERRVDVIGAEVRCAIEGGEGLVQAGVERPARRRATAAPRRRRRVRVAAVIGCRPASVRR